MSTVEKLRAMGVEEPERRRFSLEVFGEVVLLLLVGGFFAYMFIESLNWTLGAALAPRIAIAIGTPFLIYRLVFLLRHTRSSPAEIMDIGFRIGADPAAEAQRFTRIILFIVLLYLGIWVFGFHVALPLGMFAYLYVYGGIGFRWSVVIAALFLALIVGIYDQVLHIHWHEPLLFRLLGLQ
jgi:hypothetical protein